MTGLSILLAIVVAVLLMPAASDALSLVRGRARRRVGARPAGLPRLLFVVPAHDEERLIGDCVSSLRSLRYPPDRRSVVVVADNCADRTAARARAAGARVLERTDPGHPGKPHAIAWALGELPLDRHDAVVIVDADTTADPDFAEALSHAAPLEHKVLQAYFGVANPGDSALTRMAAVLAAANFRFAYPFKTAAGLNVPLLGNGMCIGVGVLATQGWQAFTIAEDWELYARYTAGGVRIESVCAARIFALEARSLRESSTQRQRWTAGKLTVLWRYAGAVLRSRRIGLHQKLDAVGELSAPGPVVHLGVVTTASLLIASLGVPAGAVLLAALWIPMLRVAIYTVVGLAVQPDPFRAAAAFLFLPAYAAWRIVAAVAALKMVGDAPWVRTSRP
jgi:cellulose synthase/poly-beta-1,6-N-acetylglucosamine synthase-like glycosyltransferase